MANSKNITFDQLQNALTRVKSALDGKANASHGNHVPKTETANNAKFLRNDNTWQTITPVNIGAADRSHSHGSYVNQNAFTNIKVGDTTVAADSPTDTLTLTAGANITITPDATNDNVTIAAKDTVYTHPTTSGNKHIPSGGSSGQILRWSADGTAAWGSDNNTDTKVTNTLNTTAKAYVTGTTSATTNTGTQVFDTGVYLDTTAGKLVATTFEGALSGNASSATKLQNARNFKIGNTSRSFNGTADVTWTLSDIGAAASSHTHSYLPLSGGTVSKSEFGPLFIERSGSANGASIGFKNSNGTLGYIGMNNAADGGLIRWSADTKTMYTVLDSKNYNTYAAAKSHGTHVSYATAAPLVAGTSAVGTSDKVAREDHVHPAQTAVTGNAGTATKLKTARKINDIPFDGSADKTIPLKTFGSYVGNDNAKNYHRILSSGNVTGQHADKSITLMASSDYDGGSYGIVRIILRTNSSTSTSSGRIEWIVRKGFALDSIVFNIKNTAGATIMDVFYKCPGTYACVTWTVLGEGDRDGRNGNGGYGGTWTKYNTAAGSTETYTADTMKTIASYTSTMNQGTDVAHVNTSAKLNTARSINGTNFDGTGNITTSKWGTARTIKIGNTGKSVNGSENITWTLDEIGVAAKSHGNHVPATQTADNKKFLRNDNTWQTVTPANIGAVPIDTGGNITIHADSDASSTSEYALIKAGHNELKIASSAGGGTVTKGQDKLTFNGNIVYHAGRKPTLSELGAAASNHTHDYAAKSHTHNYAGSSSAGGNANAAVKLATARTLTIGSKEKTFDGSGNVSWSLSEIGAAASSHNHDSAYLKLSGGTLSGQLTVNNNVQAQGFCVSKNNKEVWLDIGDNDTYIWASGANKSLQITHGGDLNYDGKPVIYGGRGNSFSTAVGSIYFKNSANTYAARISSYHNTDLDQDYAHMGIRDANDNMPNYINLYPDTVRIKSNNIELGGKRLTIATSAPSNPTTGDVWINIG